MIQHPQLTASSPLLLPTPPSTVEAQPLRKPAGQARRQKLEKLYLAEPLSHVVLGLPQVFVFVCDDSTDFANHSLLAKVATSADPALKNGEREDAQRGYSKSVRDRERWGAVAPRMTTQTRRTYRSGVDC
jgi:hypothetical protein